MLKILNHYAIRTELLFIAILLLSSAANAQPKPEAMVNMRSLRLGVILPLTGPASEHGAASLNGLKLGLKEAGVEKTIEIVVEDDGFVPKNTVTAFRSLIESGKIDLVLTAGSGPSNAVAPIADRAKIPLLALAGDLRVAKNRPSVIRMRMSAFDEGKQIAKALLARKYSNISVICAENSFTQGVCDGVSSNLHEQNYFRENIPPDETDFRGLCQKIKSKKSDAIVILLLPGKIGLFAKQARLAGLSSDFAGGVFFESDVDLTISQGSLVNSFYVMPDPSEEFVALYESRFPKTGSIAWASIFYDVAKMLSKIDNNKGLVEQLKSIREFPSVNGNLNYASTSDGDSYFSYPFVLKTITKKGYKRLN